MDLEKAKRAIKGAWIAGAISGAVTLVFVIAAVAGADVLGFNILYLLDVFLIFGLAYGIYKKSRTCAVIMFVYFVASKVIIWQRMGSLQGLPVAIAFGYFFFQGIRGTFAYHGIKKAEKAPEQAEGVGGGSSTVSIGPWDESA